MSANKTGRWTRDAVLARLDAVRALDSATRLPLEARARYKLRLIRLADSVENGAIPAEEAEAEFRAIREAATASAEANPSAERGMHR